MQRIPKFFAGAVVVWAACNLSLPVGGQTSPQESTALERSPIRSGSSVPIVVRHEAEEGQLQSQEARPVRESVRQVSGIGVPASSAPALGRANLNVVVAQPSITMETVGPAEINLGKTATFTITVQNIGESAAREVLVQAAIPGSAHLEQAEPQPQIEDGILLFEIGDLAARSKREIKLDLIPSERGPIDVAAKASFAMYTQSVLQVRQPELAMEIQGPQEAMYGEDVPFRLMVSNKGDGPAENVKLEQAGPADPSDKGSVVIKNLPDVIALIPAGATRSFELLASASSAGNVAAALNALEDGGSEASASLRFLVRQAILNIETQGPKLRFAERSADYSIIISNPGDAVAENVKVEVALPEGMRISAIERRASLDKARGVLSWNLDQLAPGGSEVLKFRAKAVEEGDQQHVVTVTANHGLSAEATHTTRVMAYADIVMTVTDTVSPIEVGGTVEYEIYFKNRGTKTAENVVIKAQLPDGLGALDSGDYHVALNELTFQTIHAVSPGEEKKLTFRAVGSKAGSFAVRITLSSDSLNIPLVVEEGTRFYETDGQGIPAADPVP